MTPFHGGKRNFVKYDETIINMENDSDKDYATKSINVIAERMENSMELFQAEEEEQLPMLSALMCPSTTPQMTIRNIPSPTLLFPDYNEPLFVTPQRITKPRYKKLDINPIRKYIASKKDAAYEIIQEKLQSHEDTYLTPAGNDFVILNKNGVKVCFHSLIQLKNPKMIDDQIINYCFKDYAVKSLMKKKKNYYCSTFFYPALKTSEFSEVKSWISKNAVRKYLAKYNKQKYDLEITSVYDFDLLFFPIHLGLHWTLAVFNRRLNIAIYLDSLGSYDITILCEIEDYLNKISEMEGGQTLTFDKKCIQENIQRNGVDCGVYVLLNTFIFKQSRYKSFTGNDVRCFRKYLYTKFLAEGNQ